MLPSHQPKTRGSVRWWIVWTLFFSTVTNYISRHTFTVLAPVISGFCIRRGVSVVKARIWVCIASCLPILAGIPAAHVHSVYRALALICFALWGYASWSTMGLTLPSDLFPQDVVATVTELSGLSAGLVGAVFTFAVGILVDRFPTAQPSWWPV